MFVCWAGDASDTGLKKMDQKGGLKEFDPLANRNGAIFTLSRSNLISKARDVRQRSDFSEL